MVNKKNTDTSSDKKGLPITGPWADDTGMPSIWFMLFGWWGVLFKKIIQILQSIRYFNNREEYKKWKKKHVKKSKVKKEKINWFWYTIFNITPIILVLILLIYLIGCVI